MKQWFLKAKAGMVDLQQGQGRSRAGPSVCVWGGGVGWRGLSSPIGSQYQSFLSKEHLRDASLSLRVFLWRKDCWEMALHILHHPEWQPPQSLKLAPSCQLFVACSTSQGSPDWLAVVHANKAKTGANPERTVKPWGRKGRPKPPKRFSKGSKWLA